MIAVINYNKVTRAIKRNALGTTELTVTCTWAADGAHMQPVPVSQHLDAMIAAVAHNKVALIIKRNITAASELPVVAAPAAHAADVRAIA
jgi:hypothetical protein